MQEAAIYSYIGKSEIYVLLPDGGKWVRGFLKDSVGKNCYMEWERDSTGRVWWKVKKTHLEALSQALQRRYEGLWIVREYSARQVCTGSCKTALKDICECSCGGQYHGHADGSGWKNVVGDVMILNEITTVTRYYGGEENE